MKFKYKVSVIIPTYHDWQRLVLCLDALKKQSYALEDFEVIIVNNDPDDTPANLDLPKNFRLISESKPGSYAARNAGLRISLGEIIAFTDSDCIPHTDWIKNSVVMLSNGEERISGRVQLFYKTSNLTYTEIYEKVFAFDQEDYAKNGVAATANMITWRKHFDKVGLFNDSLMSGGDHEWGTRAAKLGIPIVYSSNVIVFHPARESFYLMLRKARRVAGGIVAIDRTEYKNHVFKTFVKGYLPPFGAFSKAFKRKDVNFKEKLIASVMVYFLKVYTTSYKIKYMFSSKNLERL